MSKKISFDFRDGNFFSQEEITASREKIYSHLDELLAVAKTGLYEKKESFINLPQDSRLTETVSALTAKKKNSHLRTIFLLGIGGSNLGTLAVYDALRGQNFFSDENNIRIFFLDTVSPLVAREAEAIVKKAREADEILTLVISKSGSTTETVANFEFLYALLNKKWGEKANERIIVITDSGSNLEEKARAKNWEILNIPAPVGGRYSVFSAVGLLPLALAGFDISKFQSGAAVMLNDCLSKSEDNPALMSAILIFLHFYKGLPINNIFFFNPELESLGKWYRQLMGESIGKEKNLTGEIVNIGITPMISIGSVDLHSMVQLYLGGPRDKFTSFVYIHQQGLAQVPTKTALASASLLANKDFAEIMSAILEGVKTAYRERKLPFISVSWPEISEFYLGQFMQFKMLEMIFLARLLNVNAFDQPSVEEYKKETKKILKG